MSTLRQLRQLRFRADHRWTPPRVSPYLDGDLTAGARARLQRHMAQCPDCRGLLLSLERLVRALHALPSPARAEAPELSAHIRAALAEAGR